ncbi:tetratricopeptide repeat protein [bacterium]|nr:tetratricopeptide repeat protein [bacterium]MBP9806697.1 tetratricopeptide repeat protein [bacterium]
MRKQTQPLAILSVIFSLASFPVAAYSATTGVVVKKTAKSNVNKPLVEPGESLDSKLLFNQVATLYREGKFEEALKTLNSGKEAQKIAADSFLFHLYQAVLLFKTKPLIYPLAAARAAVKINGRNAVANSNLGSLLQRNGERANAIEKYRAALAADPSDWRAHLGIAQCLAVDGTDGRVIAERELKLACQTANNTLEKWLALGATYLVLRLNQEAETCYSNALKLKPDDYVVKLGRLKSAVAANNLSVVKELLPTTVTDRLVDQSIALALALPEAQLSISELTTLETICERNFIGSDQFFYQLGRNLEACGQLDLAAKAYLQAIKYSGAGGASVLALVGNRAAVGDLDEANRLLAQYVGTRVIAGKPQPRGHKEIFTQALSYSAQILSTNSTSLSGSGSLRIMRAVFSNIKCGCRIPVIEFKLRSLHGVIFAHLQDAKNPPACIVYDDKLIESNAIIATKRDEDKVEVMSDQPVKSLPELVKIIQDAAEKPDKHIFTLWSFEPPPMELPK